LTMRTDKIALSGLIACLSLGGLALTGAGCAGTRTERSTGAYLDDKGIETRVKTALFRDPAVSGFDVHVNTFRGDVQLSGFVDTSEQKERAAQIAREIPGVVMVTNNLEVKPAGTAVGTSGATVQERSGVVTDSIPERPAVDQYRDVAPVRTPGTDLDRTGIDRSITDPLNRDLAPRSLDTLPAARSPQDLRIDAANGTATLRGSVSSESEKRDIERRIRDIPGIMNVENQLEVRDSSR